MRDEDCEVEEQAEASPGPERFLLAESGESPWEPEIEPILYGDRVLPIGVPNISQAERDLVAKTIASGWVSGNAPIIREFESDFARRIGVTRAIACNSGGSALLLLLRSLGIGPGDEVVVPTFTMIATAGVVSHIGAVPVFADCDADTLNVNANSVARCITPRTKAVICVHLYGHPCEMEPLRELCTTHSVTLLEDAAEAHGARWRGVPCGALGDAAAFGFYGNKVMVTGEGGMITTNDEELAGRVSSYRHYCISPDRHFWHQDLGYSMRLPALSAALGLAQLRRLEELLGNRQAVARRYDELFSHVNVKTAGSTLRLEGDSEHCWWHYWIRTDRRAAVRYALAENGFETRAGFAPMHLQPCYAKGAYPFHVDPVGCAVADRLCREVLLLPTHSNVRAVDQQRIVEIIDTSTCS